MQYQVKSQSHNYQVYLEELMNYYLVPAPPALEHQSFFPLQVEQSRHPTLPSGRHNPKRTAIP